jgi:Mrp family chromosome partitioning ATPase
MSANEKVYDPMDSLLTSFTAGENATRKKWWAKADATPGLAEALPVRPADGEILRLVQCVFLAPAALAPRRVMFCGIDEDSSSEICANAGRVLAQQTGSSVCLVDANIRNGRLSKIFDMARRKTGQTVVPSWRNQCAYVDTDLFVADTGLLRGSENGIAPARELRERIAALASTFEYLLIDAPAVNTSSETGVIGQVAGSAVLVLQANSTRRAEAKKAKDSLQMADVRILGTVLDNHSR